MTQPTSNALLFDWSLEHLALLVENVADCLDAGQSIKKCSQELRGIKYGILRHAPEPSEDLVCMQKDAARYEWIRENWAGIITHFAPGEGESRGVWVVTLIEAFKSHRPTDPQTIDQAIDAAMNREDSSAITKGAAL
jgi:hypothetical protein